MFVDLPGCLRRLCDVKEAENRGRTFAQKTRSGALRGLLCTSLQNHLAIVARPRGLDVCLRKVRPRQQQLFQIGLHYVSSTLKKALQ